MQLIRFGDLPVQRKMLWLILLMCGTVLVVATAALFAFQIYAFRVSYHEDTATLAQIIADNSTVAVGCDDAKAAKQILGSLKAKPYVNTAFIVRANGSVLAQFPESVQNNLPLGFPAPGRFGYADGQLLYSQSIQNTGAKPLGTLYLRVEYHGAVVRMLGFHALVILFVVAISIGLTALLLGRIQRVITDPVVALARTVHLIAEKQDYSLRVEAIGRRDELGQLTRAFNQILSRIESREATLWRSQEKLEALVHSVDGMAEVATGVLHNVGNVLNSVDVSCALSIDRLRRSEICNLPKVAAMLAQQNGNLGKFLTHDPKGKQIPVYLAGVAPLLVEEQYFVLQELHSQRDKIEHINEIVRVQQSYAKVSSVTETLFVNQLVEDALKLDLGALARHEIRVERQFEDLPPVSLEKHKVLQILLNLIRNGKHALEDGGHEPKVMTFRVLRLKPDRFAIQVSDNGVGIPSENLTKIFAHGFTTRKSGHGFGLHSGALAATELGGSLTAESAGLGHGATFTLELPFRPQTPS